MCWHVRDAPELRRAEWAAPWNDLSIQAEWLLAGPALTCFDAKSLLKLFMASLPAVSQRPIPQQQGQQCPQPVTCHSEIYLTSWRALTS